MRESRRWVGVVVAVFSAGLAVGVVNIPEAPAASTIGELTFADCVGGGIGCVATGGSQASAFSLAVSHSGKTLYAGFNNGTGTDGGISRFSVGATGTLSYTDCISGGGSGGQCAITSPNDPGALIDPLNIALSPNDRSLYVDDFKGSEGFVDHLFALPDQGGKLQWDGCISGDGSGGHCAAAGRAVNPLLEPTGIAVSPDGASVYVGGSMGTGQATGQEGVATHFLANANGGQLTFDGCVNNDGANNSCGPVPGSSLGSATEGVAVSPSGDVYVGATSAIAHFTPTTGGGMPFSDCISSDASSTACTKAPGGIGSLRLPLTFAVSSDGKQLYALDADQGIDHLTLGTGGRMAWADCVSNDGTGGTCAGLPIAGGILAAPTDLAISPDGTSLYVISNRHSVITAFNIGASGTLTFAECLTSQTIAGCTTDPRLEDPDRVAISPDGKSVYVTANSSILHFTRATSGTGAGGTSGGTGGTGTGSTGTGAAGTGSTGSVGGGGSATHTVSTTAGNLGLSFSLQSATTCSTAASTLHPKLSVTANPKSKAIKWTFAKASFFLDGGIRQVHHVTVRRNGKSVKITTVTFAANQTLSKAGTAPLKLKGLKSGAHTLAVQVLLHRPAPKGTKVMPSLTKTLRTSFKVC